MKYVIIFLSTVVIGFIGMVIGTMIGMDIGGNYFVNFTMFGVRGYEATGQLGMIIGGVLFGFIGFLVPTMIFRAKAKRSKVT